MQAAPTTSTAVPKRSSSAPKTSPKPKLTHTTAAATKTNAAAAAAAATTKTAVTAVDPTVEIEEISKKISEHADAIYRTWKSRGLAPTELLEFYTSAAAETAGTPATIATASGDFFVRDANVAASTEGLQKLVSSFVSKDREQRGAQQMHNAGGGSSSGKAKSGIAKASSSGSSNADVPKTKTLLSTSSSSVGVVKLQATTTTATQKIVKQQQTQQQQQMKPATQKLTTADLLKEVDAVDAVLKKIVKTAANQTAAATRKLKIENAQQEQQQQQQQAATTAQQQNHEHEHKTAKLHGKTTKTHTSGGGSGSGATITATTPTTPTKSAIKTPAALGAGSGKSKSPTATKLTPTLDINLNLDVNNLTQLQTQNLRKIQELLQENADDKTKTKKSAAATATKANNNGAAAAGKTTAIDQQSSNNNNKKLIAKNARDLNVITDVVNAVAAINIADAADKNNSVGGAGAGGGGGGGDAVSVVSSGSGSIMSGTSGSSSNKRGGGITTSKTSNNAKLLNEQQQQQTRQKQALINTANKTKDDANKTLKTPTTATATTAINTNANANATATNKTVKTHLKESSNKESSDNSKTTITTATAIDHAKKSDSKKDNNSSSNSNSEKTHATTSPTTNTTTSTSASENVMEVARSSMPTPTKIKSGRTLTNGQDKNLGRPILTRGSVAERVLMFEKCPDVRNSFLNIKRPDPAEAPPKSLLKVKLHATPPPPSDHNSLQREIRSTKSVYIPRFYFPHGKPQPTIALERTLRGILSAFDSFPNNQVTKDELPRILKICGLPFYWRMPVMVFCQQGSSGLVERQRFVEFWKQMNIYCHEAASRFVYILSRGQRIRSYILPEDLAPLVQDVVDTHPGLAFLKEATEFHSRYVHTVIARIFYSVNRCWSGKITIAELKKSDLLEIITLLEEEDDINQIMAFFSYEHFYVIYCKFWELDKDHDLLINQEDLAGHSDHALSTRIVERIFSGCVTRSDNKKSPDDEPKMSYTDFVWFLLSEEDKRTPTAIEYWFRCMDIDGDGVLSMYELEYFYEEQQQRMESIGIETLPFEDCLCQMLDMIKPQNRDCVTLSDLKRCKMTHVFFDTFFNLEKYLDHEQRDPFASQRDEYASDWDRFAAQEYELLITEESE